MARFVDVEKIEECRWGKGETPDEDDFCSYGERKERDENG